MPANVSLSLYTPANVFLFLHAGKCLSPHWRSFLLPVWKEKERVTRFSTWQCGEKEREKTGFCCMETWRKRERVGGFAILRHACLIK
jgi:hypothetical protein